MVSYEQIGNALHAPDQYGGRSGVAEITSAPTPLEDSLVLLAKKECPIVHGQILRLLSGSLDVTYLEGGCRNRRRGRPRSLPSLTQFAARTCAPTLQSWQVLPAAEPAPEPGQMGPNGVCRSLFPTQGEGAGEGGEAGDLQGD